MTSSSDKTKALSKQPEAKGNSAVASKPAASRSKNKNHRDTPKSQKSKKDKGVEVNKRDKSVTPETVPDAPGVGADNNSFTFKIGVIAEGSNNSKLVDNPELVAKIELAPARKSFYEKAAVQPPGGGAGLEIRSRSNITKLNVPASRPIYQHFGMSEETLHWVGAFIGTDVEIGNSVNTTNLNYDTWRDNTNTSGWDQSQKIIDLVRQGRPLGIQLSWFTNVESFEHTVGFMPFKAGKESKTQTYIFTGFIKEITRAYATQQRVYYSVSFVITNRHDINKNNSIAPQINLPKEFQDEINSFKDENALRKAESDALNLKSSGGLSPETYKNVASAIQQNAAGITAKLDKFSDSEKKEIEDAMSVFAENSDAISDPEKIKALAKRRIPSLASWSPIAGGSVVAVAQDKQLFEIIRAEAVLSKLESDPRLNGHIPPEAAIARRGLATMQTQINVEIANSAEPKVKPQSTPPPPKPVPPKAPNPHSEVNSNPNAVDQNGKKL